MTNDYEDGKLYVYDATTQTFDRPCYQAGVKMPPDDAYAFREALEPLTRKMTSEVGNAIALASIAVSLKRIADAMPLPQFKDFKLL